MTISRIKVETVVDVRVTSLPWPQLAAMVLSVLLALLGLAGFAVTGFDDYFGAGPDYVLGLRVNPLQNTVYLVTGLIGLALCWRPKSARVFGALMAPVYLVVFAIGAPSGEVAGTGPLNANSAMGFVHLLVGFAGVVIAQGCVHIERSRRRHLKA
ncbi:DUF4383 domain-containing protein [Umezawaea sp. Da 62-37]|uniref:DUF4383 domain-containing protein n=1 Tax=Umezawaea sp. Da 62-37 TaxID=3075927 RepID=UPI0028F738C1|nr:DUF4383 domain-containing protein [Umezawaea sp. Da 62-37]WNV89377.1 DUF4383 domain-containing protein [Umezawaea sp. Da 62-37]